MDEVSCTVYMDRRDVTPWVKSVEIDHDDSMTRKFNIEFTAWHSFGTEGRWDIFGSYDAANPRAEVLIRNGLLDPAQRKQVSLSRRSAPRITAKGYEWVWLAQRRRPSKTIVFAPAFGNLDAAVQVALANYDGPIGEYVVWYGIDSNHTLVQKLMQAVGVNTSCRFPRHSVAPFVMDPEKSYYKQVLEIVEPYAVQPYYVRSTNTIVLSDQRDAAMGAGNTMRIPDEIVDNLVARPRFRSRPTRVIVRFPPWR
jgi:hypothetical protein